MIVDYSQEGLPIEFDENSAEIIYKDNRVSLYLIKSALESGMDRVQLTEDLEYTESGGFINFGCLTLSKEKTQILFRKLWKQLKTFKATGN